MNTGTMRAQGVCKSFGKKAVLRELELTLEPGKIYGLLGRNGAGQDHPAVHSHRPAGP